MAEFATPHDYPDEYDHPIGSEPGFDETEIGDALTADGGDDALIDDCLPDDDTSSDAKGRDPSNIAEGEHERPFTIVEFGAGIAPILMHRNAPDVQQLFRKGGRYMALDATPSYVKTGRETSQLYIDVYSSPGVEVEAHFMHAAIHADTPLPPEVALGSADRVVLSNLLTLPNVASDLPTCLAIADTAARLLRPGGEVVVVGTTTPYICPASEVTALMERVGLAPAGSDDIRNYLARDAQISPDMYAERYRRRADTHQ